MFGMVSIASFLQFMAALLVFGSVNCDFIVGHGKHKMVNGEIKELKGNTMIAKNDDDIKRYMKLDGSCDVEMDANKNIILWYKKDSKTKSDGCSVDFVTKKEGQISLEFGIQNSGGLANCIDKFGVKTVVVNVMLLDNVLAFAFSLTNEEFKELKNGPKKGKDSDCSDKGKCKECFNNKVLYSIGWKEWADETKFHKKYNFIYFMNAVGDEFKGYLSMIPSDTDLKEASFKLLINGEKFRFEKGTEDLSTSCYKKLSKPERWNIMDKTYKDENLKSLLTFHIMPVKAMRKTMQNIFLNCIGNVGEDCDDNASMQNCSKMFIKFDKKHFQLLVPSTTTTKNYMTTTSKIKSGSIDFKIKRSLIDSTSKIKISSIDTIEYSSTKTSKKPNNTTAKKPDETETEDSGIGIFTIIMIIVGIIILVLLVIYLLIWFFVFRGKDEEEPTVPIDPNQPKNSDPPMSTNFEKEEEYDEGEVQNNPLAEAKEDDRPVTVVQTQHDRFNDAETVGTQMGLEDSKIIGEVDVPEIIKLEDDDEKKENEQPSTSGLATSRIQEHFTGSYHPETQQWTMLDDNFLKNTNITELPSFQLTQSTGSATIDFAEKTFPVLQAGVFPFVLETDDKRKLYRGRFSIWGPSSDHVTHIIRFLSKS